MNNIIFSHANGFPAKSYSYLFDLLSPHTIHYLNKLGHGNYKVKKDWQPLADELIEFAEKFEKPIIGIGHSVGGVATLYAAAKRKDVFSKIILLDPPLVAGSYKRYLLLLTKVLGLVGHLLPIAKKAKNRKRQFHSKQEALEYFKTKKLFQLFHPSCLADYVEHGLEYNASKDEYELAFSADIEYDIFCSSPDIYPFSSTINIPIYLIYSRNIVSIEDLKWYKKKFPQIELIDFKAGHMFPLEEPERTASLIQSLL